MFKQVMCSIFNIDALYYTIMTLDTVTCPHVTV